MFSTFMKGRVHVVARNSEDLEYQFECKIENSNGEILHLTDITTISRITGSDTTINHPDRLVKIGSSECLRISLIKE